MMGGGGGGGGSLVSALIYELQGVKEIKIWWRLNGYTGRVNGGEGLGKVSLDKLLTCYKLLVVIATFTPYTRQTTLTCLLLEPF